MTPRRPMLTEVVAWGRIRAVLVAASLAAAVVSGGAITSRGLAAEEGPESGAAPAGKFPANRWMKISAGELPSTKSVKNAKRIYNKPIWVPEMNAAICWPSFTKAGGHFYTFSAAAGKWSEAIAEFPPKQDFAPGLRCPLAGVYLPKAKKLLFVYQNTKRFSKPLATTWLLDPIAKKWEIQTNELRMCDDSAKFNPSAFKKDWTVPFWGDLVYDAGNEEAVAFGGACTWGRVSREKEEVAPGDWIYDETSDPKRVRRLPAKGGAVEARKWYPAQTGTWTFSEETEKWTPTEQPMSGQPSGRILSQMAFDAAEKKIVLFGGDDRARCLGDTWIYDCATRTWKEARPKTSPPPRAAHALVYVPEAQAVLLAGGYGGGWNKLQDVWAYSTSKNEWTRLDLDLPEPTQYCSGYYDPELKAAMIAIAPGGRGNSKWPIYALNLDLASAPKAAAEKADPRSVWHSVNGRWPGMLPDEWLKDKGAPEDPEAVRARLKSLTANQWVDAAPPFKTIERNWGSYVYDVKTHRAFAWGGGHSAYPGSDISEYDVLTNRWRNQDEPTEYYPLWKHRMSVGMPGTSFFGYSVLPRHARKSYGVDPVSRSLITWTGDVYDLEEHRILSFIGPCPPVSDNLHPNYQPAYVTASDGLYAYINKAGRLYRANVKLGKWDQVAAGGPKGRSEFTHLAHDSKRDRLVLFEGGGPGIWTYDIKAEEWKVEEVQGGSPAKTLGDSTYVPSMDAVLLVFATSQEKPESLYFYKLAERKWYSAPSEGAKPGRFSNASGKDFSPHYDPELGIVVRLTPSGFCQPLDVHLMRLVPEELKLTPLEK